MSQQPIIKIDVNKTALIRAFGLQNVLVPTVKEDNNKYKVSDVKSPQPTKNNFTASKLSAGFQEPDKPLPTSKADYLGNMLGTPVYADLTLKGGQYTDNITGRTVTYPEIRMASVLLTVNFASRIIKTEIQGRDGTVKEYIGMDDAKVQIQGIITGTNGHYPAYEVAQLNEWRRAPVAKSAVSAFLQNLGIDNLVVESCDLPQIAGGYSYQTFNMSCISDLPVELKIQ